MKNYTVKHFVAVAALLVSSAAVAQEAVEIVVTPPTPPTVHVYRTINIYNSAKKFIADSAHASKDFVVNNAANAAAFVNAHRNAFIASGVALAAFYAAYEAYKAATETTVVKKTVEVKIRK